MCETPVLRVSEGVGILPASVVMLVFFVLVCFCFVFVLFFSN